MGEFDQYLNDQGSNRQPPAGPRLPAWMNPGYWKKTIIVTGVVGLMLLIGFLALWHTFFVYVKPGHHLVLVAKFGKPMPPNRVLAEAGEEGVQRHVLGEGWHFVWPIVYATELHPNTVIPAGKVGIRTAKGGDPLPPGQWLAEDGQQGIERRILLPGEYRINLRGYDVQLVEAAEIIPGDVGVLRRLLGKEQGIVKDTVLQPGVYYINNKEYEVLPFPVGIWQTTFHYDRDPSKNTAIKFTSKGGFEISMDCTVEWEVLPHDTPALVEEYGKYTKIEENVIKLQAHAIGRDKGIDYGVQELLEGSQREKFQRDFTNELIKKCSVKNVAVRSAFIRDIVIPEVYLKPIREKQVAAETELTNAALQVTAAIQAEVETEKQLVTQKVKEVEAETMRIVAKINQDRENVASKTSSEIERLQADYQAKIAEKDAERVRVLGEAKAEAAKLTETAKNSLYQMKMEVFQGDPNAYLRYTLAESLNPKMSIRLMHSGPGTFWTNMDGKGFNLMMPAPTEKKRSPTVPEK
jgi:hypothetical protein